MLTKFDSLEMLDEFQYWMSYIFLSVYFAILVFRGRHYHHLLVF